MVQITYPCFARVKSADKFWKRRRTFKLTAHYYGRQRNCYSVAIKLCHRALAYSTRARLLKKKVAKELWETRIGATAQELGSSYEAIVYGMSRCNIALDRKSLANLAVWEPRSFKALNKVAITRLRGDPDLPKGLNNLGPAPAGVITRGML
nr:EOG090X0H9C [Triops cancriformis]